MRTTPPARRRGLAAAAPLLAFVVVTAATGCSSSRSALKVAMLDGQAQSVETTAPVAGLSSIHLSGPSVLGGTGDVTDHSGRRLGTGTLKVSGSDLVVSGSGISVRGRLRVQPGVVTLNSGDSSPATIDLPGDSTIAGEVITFQPPAPPVATTATSAVAPAPPPPVTLTGPVTVASASLQLMGASLRYLDAPVDFKLTSAEADLSWAGSGSITTTATGALRAPYLGVRAQGLNVTLHRGSAAVDMHGTGRVRQAFANGIPQLRTSAAVGISGARATTGFLNQKHAFVWTPRNLGSAYDMAILRIRPGNAAAGQVHIGLLPMPPMFGGEPHDLVGGDTSGLKGGGPVDALIAPGGDDKRSIGYDAPPGTQLLLIVEGNFDPVTVTVSTY